MQIHLPYGRSALTAQIPDEFPVDILEPVEFPPARDPQKIVNAALDAPLILSGLEGFRTAHSVAIAINDKTRPVPHRDLLPPLLERLETIGFAPRDIHLVIAVGLHGPMLPEEFAAVVPEAILRRYPVISHDAKDANNLVYLGETSHHTPVWVNKQYIEADLRIVVGNIEPHQFVGFSGGVKSAAVGLAGADTIRHNHAMLKLPESQLGEYETNPARQDVEEIGRKIGVHFALNAILNQDKKIVNVLSGDPQAVMRAGIPLSRQVCQLGIPQKYEMLVVSPGGHPKDINVYQAQKAMAHAALILRPGGTMILAAACPEGAGSQGYESWMEGMSSFAQVLERFSREEFRIGPHKAFLIARDAAGRKFYLVSEMEPALSRRLLLNPAESLQTAVDLALDGMEKGERIGILPHASSTIPYLKTMT